MKISLVASIVYSAFVGVLAFSAPAAAQQKTVAACEKEWRAHKAANQKKGITEKAYVEKCRETAAPKAADSDKKMTAAEKKKAAAEKAAELKKAAAEKAAAMKKAAAEKAAEMKKAAEEKKKAAAEKKAATTENKKSTADKKAAPAMAPADKKTAAPASESKPTGANQYAMEVQAKAHCPTGTVVWANTNSKIYHFTGNSDYGHTKAGAYMCEKDAMGQGMRAAKNEKHP